MELERFRKNIQRLRAEKGLSQQSLADAIGISRQTLSGYETGRTEIDAWFLSQVLQVFGEGGLSILLDDQTDSGSKWKSRHFFAIFLLSIIGLWIAFFLESGRLSVWNIFPDLLSAMLIQHLLLFVTGFTGTGILKRVGICGGDIIVKKRRKVNLIAFSAFAVFIVICGVYLILLYANSGLLGKSGGFWVEIIKDAKVFSLFAGIAAGWSQPIGNAVNPIRKKPLMAILIAFTALTALWMLFSFGTSFRTTEISDKKTAQYTYSGETVEKSTVQYVKRQERILESADGFSLWKIETFFWIDSDLNLSETGTGTEADKALSKEDFDRILSNLNSEDAAAMGFVSAQFIAVQQGNAFNVRVTDAEAHVNNGTGKRLTESPKITIGTIDSGHPAQTLITSTDQIIRAPEEWLACNSADALFTAGTTMEIRYADDHGDPFTIRINNLWNQGIRDERIRK